MGHNLCRVHYDGLDLSKHGYRKPVLSISVFYLVTSPSQVSRAEKKGRSSLDSKDPLHGDDSEDGRCAGKICRLMGLICMSCASPRRGWALHRVDAMHGGASGLV
ncbi:hypothetical protein SCLCIDRAFT_1218802 [Scleroderma citrinum Foug A]|uniref:Uncharacterized protein n=1 Tax=Scleroderma citrinum Foug A TaxID=1036808 RepID=A0A0C3DC28_9AGAM|nr:hypothetical protein SCLCIDRAFT_1218802 [Scleroderma citrinum Foug A]